MKVADLLGASRMAEDLHALSRSQAMIWFTPEGNVITANENFCSAVKYDLKEIVGKHHRMFCEDAIRNAPDYSQFWADLADGKVKSGQFRRQTKDGQDV
jgi:methyl-accepting chemotaxis protein